MVNVTAVLVLAQARPSKIQHAIKNGIVVLIKLAMPREARFTVVDNFCAPHGFARLTFRLQVVAFRCNLPTETAPDALRKRKHMLSLTFGFADSAKRAFEEELQPCGLAMTVLRNDYL